MKNVLKNLFAFKKEATKKEKKSIFITVGRDWGKEDDTLPDGLTVLSISEIKFDSSVQY